MISAKHPDTWLKEGDLAAFLIARHGRQEAGEIAKSMGAPFRVSELIEKVAVPAEPSSNWDDPQPLMLAWAQQMRQTNAFDAMTPSMVQLANPHVVIKSSVVGSVGDEVGEGQPIPMQDHSYSDVTATLKKAATLRSYQKETADLGGPAFVELVGAQARLDIGAKTEEIFLAAIGGTNVGEANGNDDETAVLDDMSELANSVIRHAGSSLFLFVPPRIATFLTRLAFDNGQAGMSPQGGTFWGMKTMVSENLPAGKITLADATSIAYWDGGIELGASEAAVEFKTDPTNASGPSVTAATLVSGFQTNSFSLRCLRRFAYAVVRASGVATLSGVTWGSAGSPQ